MAARIELSLMYARIVNEIAQINNNLRFYDFDCARIYVAVRCGVLTFAPEIMWIVYCGYLLVIVRGTVAASD